MWFYRFRQAFIALLLPWFVVALIQAAGRYYLVSTYGSPDIMADLAADLKRMYYIGGLFDLRVASLLFVPCLLLAGLLAITKRSFRYWQIGWPWLAALLTLVVAAFTVGNGFYYATYLRPIDVFIFGLIEDDSVAILKTIWADYPVIQGAFGLALFTAAVVWLYRAWQYILGKPPERRTRFSVSVLSTLILLAIGFVGMRGSIGTFPLRQADAQVSEVNLLNTFTPNGLIAFDWARKAHKENGQFGRATDDEGWQLFSRFFNQPTAPNLTAFLAKTEINPAAQNRPPNVVFIVMESMGYHLEQFDKPGRDLYGALREHWFTDWRFKRFISEGNGTIDSLNRLFVRSPMNNISQSKAQATDFDSNMFKPYLANGYKIIFVTSGNGAWRNLNPFLTRLGVSEFMEQNGLKKRYPEAPLSTWGVPDEYMFRYIQTRLAQAEKENERVLIMAMSTTHHPPYQAPESYTKTPIALNPGEQQRLSNLASDEQLTEVFHTLRYSNDQLGQFIRWVKSQPLGQHTLLAATGDHNIRGISYPDPHELVLRLSVPFYLFVPEAYRQQSHFDDTRVGSHKDIWPTLYQLSLSDTFYYQTGCNLLAQQLDTLWCQGYNPEVAITPEGAFALAENGKFRPWADETGLLLGEPQAMTTEQQNTADRWLAFTDLLWWQLNKQVNDR